MLTQRYIAFKKCRKNIWRKNTAHDPTVCLTWASSSCTSSPLWAALSAISDSKTLQAFSSSASSVFSSCSSCSFLACCLWVFRRPMCTSSTLRWWWLVFTLALIYWGLWWLRVSSWDLKEQQEKKNEGTGIQFYTLNGTLYNIVVCLTLPDSAISLNPQRKNRLDISHMTCSIDF